MSRLPARRVFPSLALLSVAVCGGLHAQVLPTRNDWGGTGLLQTPTARMAEEGEFAFTVSHTSPYTRYNVMMQPFPWFEGVYRYVNVAGVPYGPESLSGDQNYKDKSIDFKIRLWEEGRWLPQVAFGAQDFGGTGLFSSEYLVASKRFGDFDVSAGLATGYLGSNGTFANPLKAVDDRFETRPRIRGTGDFNSNAMFRGRVGVFGGVSWQTPWEPLQLKLEYDGHSYDQEPSPRRIPIDIEQRSRLNLGLTYTPRPTVQVSLGWERGNELAASLVLRNNLKDAPRRAGPLDPEKVPFRPEVVDGSASVGEASSAAATRTRGPESTSQAFQSTSGGGDPLLAGHDWEQVRKQLIDNAGFYLQRVEVADREVILHGNQTRYLYTPEALGRAARVLDNVVDPSVEWFTLEHNRQGMPIAQSSVSRSALAAYARRDIDLETLAQSVELNPPGASRTGTTAYERPYRGRFSVGVAPGLKDIVGGPDGFILYQITANVNASYGFSRSTWLSGTVATDVLNNFDKFKYDAPSKLPRVRTDMRQYVTTSDVTIPNLQLTTAHALGGDWYGMAYAGLLESMFGGVGGEILYRPMGERWALGFDANWVKQRDYDQRFTFRKYEVATGHATLYYDFGRERRVHLATSAGRYLAKDWGVTVDVSRVFRNGVVMGAYATKTNISSAEFGEGSFDKGIYLTVPVDLLMPRSSRERALLWWQPLVRDGGARLSRTYGLYRMTHERDSRFFFDNLEYIDP